MNLAEPKANPTMPKVNQVKVNQTKPTVNHTGSPKICFSSNSAPPSCSECAVKFKDRENARQQVYEATTNTTLPDAKAHG